VALSRDDIVRTAVRLLDEVGLEGLTLRRLATEVGVSAPTLYWHVRDKRELLDLMAEQMIDLDRRSGEPRPGQPWWEWLAEQAWVQWEGLVAHRDAALVAAGNRPTPVALPLIERTIGTLVTVGFPPGEALTALLTVGHYVLGCAVEHQAEAARDRDRDRDGNGDADGDGGTAGLAREVADGDRYPHVAAAMRAREPGGDAAFGYGLDLLVTGLRARHAQLVAPARAVYGRSG
jgi:TetR/AcrR family tetracycline transcriptional repressor